MNVAIFQDFFLQTPPQRNAGATTTGFVSGRSVEAKCTVMKNTKKKVAKMLVKNKPKTKGPLIGKKKEAKNNGVLFKNASWRNLNKIQEPKSETRMKRNAYNNKRPDSAPQLL